MTKEQPMNIVKEVDIEMTDKHWKVINFLQDKHHKEEDLIDDLDGILTIGDFYNRADQDNTHLLFI